MRQCYHTVDGRTIWRTLSGELRSDLTVNIHFQWHLGDKKPGLQDCGQ